MESLPLTTPSTPGERRPVYLVVWWDNRSVQSGLYENPDLARFVAEAHNGVLISFLARDVDAVHISDFYWRDEAGNPMPATWRTLSLVPHRS